MASLNRKQIKGLVLDLGSRIVQEMNIPVAPDGLHVTTHGYKVRFHADGRVTVSSDVRLTLDITKD